MTYKAKNLFNGPQTHLSDCFIDAVDARFDDRPWTPSDEVCILRALNAVARIAT